MKIPTLLFILILSASKAAHTAQTVNFTTEDGCKIEAFYQPPSSGALVFINAHGLGSNKNEWAGFEKELKLKGHGWLSLDFRGHGQSLTCRDLPVDYRVFSPASWASLSLDIRAGAGFLQKKGINGKRLILCGASIGANLSLKAASEGVKPAGIVLLSPGLSYAGIEAAKYINKKNVFPLFMAASPADGYAWQSSSYLVNQAKAFSLPVVFVPGVFGHGVEMFKAQDPQSGIQSSLAAALMLWVTKLK